jgi:hypothetical protein
MPSIANPFPKLSFLSHISVWGKLLWESNSHTQLTQTVYPKRKQEKRKKIGLRIFFFRVSIGLDAGSDG